MFIITILNLNKHRLIAKYYFITNLLSFYQMESVITWRTRILPRLIVFLCNCRSLYRKLFSSYHFENKLSFRYIYYTSHFNYIPMMSALLAKHSSIYYVVFLSLQRSLRNFFIRVLSPGDNLLSKLQYDAWKKCPISHPPVKILSFGFFPIFWNH